jgi:hypothetical protein
VDMYACVGTAPVAGPVNLSLVGKKKVTGTDEEERGGRRLVGVNAVLLRWRPAAASTDDTHEKSFHLFAGLSFRPRWSSASASLEIRTVFVSFLLVAERLKKFKS